MEPARARLLADAGTDAGRVICWPDGHAAVVPAIRRPSLDHLILRPATHAHSWITLPARTSQRAHVVPVRVPECPGPGYLP